MPTPQADGCPPGTFDGNSTCFCEDHCSWSVCRLDQPPINCPRADWWSWDARRMHYVAQVNGKKQKQR